MDHLDWIGVADNGLSLRNVRNLELNCRMNGRNPGRLRYLDLNGNFETLLGYLENL